MGGIFILLALVCAVLIVVGLIGVWGVFIAGIEDRENKGGSADGRADSDPGLSGGTST